MSRMAAHGTFMNRCQMRGGSMDVRHGPNRLRYSPAMGSRIRTLLIWLLALALPAQGVAAATMVFCGPNHHGAGPVAHSQHANAEHAHRGSAAQQNRTQLGASHAEHHGAQNGAQNGAQHGAQHAGAAQADEGSSSVEVAKAPAKLKQADSQKCSACASCCSAAAILSSAPSVAAPDFSATVFATVEPSVDPFAADGPDRPPRIVLA